MSKGNRGPPKVEILPVYGGIGNSITVVQEWRDAARRPVLRRRPLCSNVLLPIAASAQGSLADYRRSDSLRTRLQGLVVDAPERATWIGNSSRFWYRNAVKDGNEFVLFDAAAREAAAAHPNPCAGKYHRRRRR